MNTRTLTIGSFATAILLLALVPGSMGAAASDESAAYFNGPLGDVSWNTPLCEALLAQACFIVPAGETSATITITDDSNLPVSFFVDGVASGCASLQIDVSGGDMVHVTANGPALGALDCGSTTATTGTITISYGA